MSPLIVVARLTYALGIERLILYAIAARTHSDRIHSVPPPYYFTLAANRLASLDAAPRLPLRRLAALDCCQNSPMAFGKLGGRLSRTAWAMRMEP